MYIYIINFKQSQKNSFWYVISEPKKRPDDDYSCMYLYNYEQASHQHGMKT